jgi:MYXO-CTERM domain-containing protein
MGSFARVRWMALAALAVAATPRLASACTVCLKAFLFPVQQPDVLELPANRVAFRVLPGIPIETVRSGLALHASEGGALIPGSVKEVGGDRFFSPDGPLTPGKQYKLAYEGQCQSVVGINGQSRAETFTIVAGPPLDVPATIEPPRVTTGLLENDPAVGYNTAFVRLSFESSFFSRFGPVLALQVEIDGQPLYGLAVVSPPREVTLRALCGPDHQLFVRSSCSNLVNVPSGRRQVKIIPDIVGVDADPAPVTMDIDLSCDPPAASGCASAGRPAAPPALGWLLALAPLAAAFARRRR